MVCRNYPLCIVAGFLAFLAVSSAFGSASAATVSENTLSGLGYKEFEVSGAEQKGCVSYEFASPLVRDTEDFYKQYTIFSLHAQFGPVAGKEARAFVYLNPGQDENALAEIRANEFESDWPGMEPNGPLIESQPYDGGWARVELPKGRLREKNTIQICLENSSTTTTSRILGDSIIGRYLKPDFSGEHGFEMILSEYEPKPNTQIRVYVVLRNYGSEAARVELRYRRPELDAELPEVEIVKGSLNLSGEIGACEDRDETGKCITPPEMGFEYIIKAIKPVPMSLLPAIATYTNVFGEQTVQESNRPGIEVKLPEISVDAFLVAEKDLFNVGEPAPVKLVVKNQGKDELNNILVRFDAGQGLEISGSSEERIASIMPGETVNFNADAVASTAGEYELGCKLSYIDYNVVETGCEAIKLGYEQPFLSTLAIGGIVLLIIAIGAYLYITLK